MENLQNMYRLNTIFLQRFLWASYGDERQGHWTRNLIVQLLKASKVEFIFQVLLDNAYFIDYTLVRRSIIALIVPTGTGMTKTILALIAETYCVSKYIAIISIQF